MPDTLLFNDNDELRSPFVLNSERARQDTEDLDDPPPVFSQEMKDNIRIRNQQSRETSARKKWNEGKEERDELNRQRMERYQREKQLHDKAKAALDAEIVVGLKKEPPKGEAVEPQSDLDALLENNPEAKKIRDLYDQLAAEIGQIDAQILETRGKTFGRGKAEQQRTALRAKQEELEDQREAVGSSLEAIVQSILSEMPAQNQEQEQKSPGGQTSEIKSEIDQRGKERAALPADDDQGRKYYDGEIARLEKELDEQTGAGIQKKVEQYKSERAALPETDTQGRLYYDGEIARLQGELKGQQTPEQTRPGTASPESGEVTIEVSKTLSQTQDILRNIDNLKLQREVIFNLTLKPAQKLILNEAIKSQIQATERHLAELYPQLKSQGLLESLTAKDRAYLAEIAGDKEVAEKAKMEASKGSREKEPGELHKDVKELIERLSTESFDAFKNSRLEKKYGKGVFGKIANFLSRERDFNYGSDGPTRKANWEVLMRAGGRVLTDKKVLWSAGIAAVFGILSGGVGAAAIGVATSHIVAGTAAGRGLAEAWSQIKGEEGGTHEKLLKAEYDHFFEMRKLARKLNLGEYASDSERNALISQLIDTYHEADSGEVTRLMKERQQMLGETTEKWDKVRNKWTNIGALAGTGVGITQNWQTIEEIAHRIDLGDKDIVRHAVQRVGDGYQHIYGQAFADQYGALHAPVADQTIGKVGAIGHRLLESNQQIYLAMTRSVAPTLLKSAVVLAGALLPRIQTHHTPTEFELRGGDLDRRQMRQYAGLETPVAPPPPGGETLPEPGADGPTTGGPESGGPTPEAAAEATPDTLEKLKKLIDKHRLHVGKYVEFNDKMFERDDKEGWVKKDTDYRFVKMDEDGDLVFAEKIGNKTYDHLLPAARFVELKQDSCLGVFEKDDEPVNETEIKAEEKPPGKPEAGEKEEAVAKKEIATEKTEKLEKQAEEINRLIGKKGQDVEFVLTKGGKNNDKLYISSFTLSGNKFNNGWDFRFGADRKIQQEIVSSIKNDNITETYKVLSAEIIGTERQAIKLNVDVKKMS